MYKGARVEREGYGEGTVLSDVRCQGLTGDCYLLLIKFDDLDESVSMYDDEVDIKHNG